MPGTACACSLNSLLTFCTCKKRRMLACCTLSCSDTGVSHSSKYSACGGGQLSTPRAIPIAAGNHRAPGTLQDCPVTCAGRDGNTPKQPKSRVCATTRLEIPASLRAGGSSASPKKGTNGFHKEIPLLHPPKNKNRAPTRTGKAV